MANNVIKIKRTSVAGRVPNTAGISQGELAVNMADGILYSTNGSFVFEIGANNTNAYVSNTITITKISANGSVGTAGALLSSNGTGSYWAPTSNVNSYTTAPAYAAGNRVLGLDSLGALKLFLQDGTEPQKLYTPTTVAALPDAGDAGAGARAFVNDATATTFASTVAGGGSNKVPVYSDGTDWKIG